MAALPTSRGGRSPGAVVCAGCGVADRCAGAAPRARGPLHGTALVAASLLYFLLPALLALTGAAVGGDETVQQLGGGLAGLLLGLLIATAAARRWSATVGRETCFEPR